jgi:hypothetical protein
VGAEKRPGCAPEQALAIFCELTALEAPECGRRPWPATYLLNPRTVPPEGIGVTSRIGGGALLSQLLPGRNVTAVAANGDFLRIVGNPTDTPSSDSVEEVELAVEAAMPKSRLEAAPEAWAREREAETVVYLVRAGEPFPEFARRFLCLSQYAPCGLWKEPDGERVGPGDGVEGGHTLAAWETVMAMAPFPEAAINDAGDEAGSEDGSDGESDSGLRFRQANHFPRDSTRRLQSLRHGDAGTGGKIDTEDRDDAALTSNAAVIASDVDSGVTNRTLREPPTSRYIPGVGNVEWVKVSRIFGTPIDVNDLNVVHYRHVGWAQAGAVMPTPMPSGVCRLSPQGARTYCDVDEDCSGNGPCVTGGKCVGMLELTCLEHTDCEGGRGGLCICSGFCDSGAPDWSPRSPPEECRSDLECGASGLTLAKSVEAGLLLASAMAGGGSADAAVASAGSAYTHLSGLGVAATAPGCGGFGGMCTMPGTQVCQEAADCDSKEKCLDYGAGRSPLKGTAVSPMSPPLFWR